MNEQERKDYLKKERMANQFAMDILMPKKLILLALEHVKKEKIKRARIADIAELMKVSKTLFTHRIEQLNLDI